jgi:hypothetical protein
MPFGIELGGIDRATMKKMHGGNGAGLLISAFKPLIFYADP